MCQAYEAEARLLRSIERNEREQAEKDQLKRTPTKDLKAELKRRSKGKK